MCRSTEFKPVIDFGDNPLVNSLLTKEECGTEKTYSLLVEQCQDCHLVQIVNPIDSNKIYRNEDYLYFSGDMPKLNEYFADFARQLNRFINNATNKFIVEIGSNDGIFLKHFQGLNTVLGIDPASNVVSRALENGVPTISDFFSERLAKSILRDWGQADIIGGANCIAHLSDLHDMMKGVKVLLEENGVFWVECNYWGGMVKNKNYSLIYHDHFSYFTLKNWVDFLKDYDMEVFDAIVTPAQGGSLRIFCGTTNKHPRTKGFRELLKAEEDTNLNSYDTAEIYVINIKKDAGKLGTKIKELKKEGKTIAGYGAAAKGFSILKLAGITGEEIDYFVDDSPAKQGKFTPVTHIPVISREDAEKKLPDYFFITAPNYESVIIEKEEEFIKNGGKFIMSDCRVRSFAIEK